jgi:ABC-2 type transport system permease protein
MGAFWRRVLAMAIKEATHIARDKQVIYMALGMPVVLLLLFGYAISFDLDRLPLGLIDQDQTPDSRRLTQAMTASGAFRIGAVFSDPEQLEPAFRSGRLKVALLIERGYGRDLARGQVAHAQLILDGSDGTTAGIALGYAAGIAQAENLRVIDRTGLEFTPPLQAQVRARFNPRLESARFIVPGLIAMILAIMAVLLTALTVAREWERGSMEQLFSTPVGRLEVVLGKLLPYLVVGMVQVLLVVSVGTVLFDVPVEGSLGLLFSAALLFLACMLGQGLLISVITRSQMVSTQAGMISAFLPTILLSGFMFPIANMPWPLQALARVVPARYFIEVLRGILLKGNGLAVLWPQLTALLVFATIMVAASTVRFRRRLD